MPKKIKFFYSAARSRKAFEAAVPSNFMPRIEVQAIAHDGTPKRADIVITTTALGTPVERFAARLGAMPAVLPEADVWLDSRVSDAIAAGRELVIVGYDLEAAL